MYTEMKKGDSVGTGFQGLRRKEGEGADQGDIVVYLGAAVIQICFRHNFSKNYAHDLKMV